MSFVVDRAWVRTATTGTATLILGPAQIGHQTLATAGVVDGDWIDYLILENATWEHGTGKYSASGASLTRNLLASSSGALIALTGFATVLMTLSSVSLTWPFAGLFGTGADGSLSSGFGTVSLTRDMCYANIVFGASDKILTNGYALCALSADMSAAGAGAITAQTVASMTGGTGSATTAGTGVAALQNKLTGVGLTGGTGGAGATGAGSSGLLAADASGNTTNSTYGGGGGAGGAGQSAGGVAVAPSSFTATAINRPIPNRFRLLNTLASTPLLPFVSGGSGAGGSGGGGDGTNKGGYGGGGGGSPPPMEVYFRVLITGTNATAGLIANKGGTGGVGGAAAGGLAAGGGGGGGSAGGPILMVIGAMVGSSVAAGLDASGGAGGLGGAGSITGRGGTGGSSGRNGGIELINLAAQTYTVLAPGTTSNAGTAATGTAGGAGGVPATGAIAL